MSQAIISSEDVGALVARVEQLVRASNGKRVVVSLAGPPGSGKSYLSDKVITALNKNGIKSMVLPQDGFHLYRSQLQTLPDPEKAFARRGAPFTFDCMLFLALVKQLSSNVTLYGPSFDHKLKDPVENDIVITPDVAVVIIEGNYISLDEPCWTEIANYVDDTWFIEAPNSLLRERIIQRHLKAGISESRQQAVERVENNDLVNATYIAEHSKPTNVRIVQEY